MDGIRGQGFLGQFIKGVITAVAVTLIAVLAFALVLSLTNLSDGIIKPVNQFIKLASVFCGAAVAVKDDKGFPKGAAIGAASSVLTFLVFGLIGGGLSFGAGLFIDIACAAVMGGLSGAIAIIRKK